MQTKVLAEFVVPHLDAFNSGIVRPQNLANYFWLKLVMFHMIQSVGQFNGLTSKDPNMHLLIFVAIVTLANSIKFWKMQSD